MTLHLIVLDAPPAPTFRCVPLSATIPVRTCLARQRAAQGTTQATLFTGLAYVRPAASDPHVRGRANPYVTCRHCAQGAAMRAGASDPMEAVP